MYIGFPLSVTIYTNKHVYHAKSIFVSWNFIYNALYMSYYTFSFLHNFFHILYVYYYEIFFREFFQTPHTNYSGNFFNDF